MKKLILVRHGESEWNKMNLFTGWTDVDLTTYGMCEAYLAGRSEYVTVVFGETYGAIRHARAAVINSGTASLEAALIGTPQVVGYHVNAITALAARLLIKIKYVSLGNLILDRLAFRELLQENLTVPALMAELERLSSDEAYREKMQADYAEIRSLLGGSGASEAVARAMIESLS